MPRKTEKPPAKRGQPASQPRANRVAKPFRRATGKKSTFPVLPISDVVIFPSSIAPLVANTPRSLRLIRQVGSGDRLFVAVLQRDASLPDNRVTPNQLHTFGCLVRLVKSLRFPDESVRILVQGEARFRLEQFTSRTPFLRARGSVVTDQTDASLETEALARNASQRFDEVITLSPSLPEELKIALFNTENAARISDLIASNLNMPLADRQALLEEPSVHKRLERITAVLGREHRVLELGNQIQNKVVKSVGRHQREYYLREQLRILRKELGEQDPQSAEQEELRQRLEKNRLPREPREMAEKEIGRLAAVPPASPEYGVIRTYLEWLIDMPWTRKSEDCLEVAQARHILDRDHYNLTRAKERILEYLAVLKLKGDLKGPILCFIGPPGVGKTSLGRSVASAMGRAFIRVSLGGVHDEAEIRGHRRTYIGALPGRIIQGLRRAGTRNPVFMLDEIDKLGADFRGDPGSALMEVLDPEHNHAFVDHYLDVAFDLSGVFFIATANTADRIPPALRDRMEVLDLPGYTLTEKRHIAQRHLIPKQLRAHGLRPRNIRFPKETVSALIEQYTREAGVRNLEREIASLSRKLALRAAERKTTRKATVSPPVLRALLGPRKFSPETAESVLEPGVATGLAWTPAGGEILFVELARMPGKGKIILTGSLGDVLKESALAALSLVRAKGYGGPFDPDFSERNDLHVHVPAGAIAKDGPSAGLAIVAALASLLREQPVPADIAMTGEITLRGRVLSVGGVKEKILAAARAGIRTVILPLRNRSELADIPADVRKAITFRFVGTVASALRILFEGQKKSTAAATKKRNRT